MGRFSPTVVPQVFAPGPTGASRIFDTLSRGAGVYGRYRENQELEKEEAEKQAWENRLLRLKYGIVPSAELNELDPEGFNRFMAENTPGETPNLADQRFGAREDEDASGLPGNFNLFTGTFNPVRPEAIGGLVPGGGVRGDRGPAQGASLRAALPPSFNPDADHPLLGGDRRTLDRTAAEDFARTFERSGGLPLPGGGGQSAFINRRYPDAIPLDDEYSIVPELTLDYQLEQREKARERAEVESFVSELGGLPELEGIDPQTVELLGRYGGMEEVTGFVLDKIKEGDTDAADEAAAEILRTDPNYAPFFGSITSDKGAAKTLLELQEARFRSQLDIDESYRRRGPAGGGGELTAFQERSEMQRRAGATARSLLDAGQNPRHVPRIIAQQYGIDEGLALEIVQGQVDKKTRRDDPTAALDPAMAAFIGVLQEAFPGAGEPEQ